MPGELTSSTTSRARRTAPAARESPESDSGGSDKIVTRNTEKSDARVGPEYQAIIPPMEPRENLADVKFKETLVWKPSESISDEKLNEYFRLAHEKYNYNQEQCFGMLCFHNFDLEETIADLENYVPYTDEWSVEEKVMFEEAFSQYGKYFNRIKSMLSDKSIASLVNYYYLWKKSGTRKSYLDVKQAKGAHNADDEEEDSDSKYSSRKNRCSNTKCGCTLAYLTGANGPNGPLCRDCHEYFRRTGNMRTVASHGLSDAERSQKGTICPKGMKLDKDELYSIIKHPELLEKCTNAMQTEIANSRRAAQNNRHAIALLKEQLKGGIDEYKLPEIAGRPRCTYKWTSTETRWAIQGFRKYGENFHAIAKVIGNKYETHVKQFYLDNKDTYRLDDLIAQAEADKKAKPAEEIELSDSEKEEDDEGNEGTSSNNKALSGLSLSEGS